MIHWLYSDKLSQDRIDYLSNFNNFDDIVEKIRKEKKIVKHSVEDSTCYKNCRRHSFVINITPMTFDLFFNSPGGYRGQFLKGSAIGKLANRKLIDSLIDDLLAFTDRHCREAAEASLRGESAKIWIHQSSSTLNEKTYKTLSPIEVQNPTWLKFAKSVVNPNEKTIRRKFFKHRYKAVLGIRAPIGINLEVKGAFLKEDGTEVVPLGKFSRAKQIRYYGFS